MAWANLVTGLDQALLRSWCACTSGFIRHCVVKLRLQITDFLKLEHMFHALYINTHSQDHEILKQVIVVID